MNLRAFTWELANWDESCAADEPEFGTKVVDISDLIPLFSFVVVKTMG